MNIGSTPQPRRAAPLPAPAMALELATLLDSILGPLLLAIAAQFRRLGARTVPVWNRVSRIRQRLATLLAHLAAGRLPRRRTPRMAPPASRLPRDPVTLLPPARLPRGHLFLVKQMGHHAAGFGSQLQHLLDRPGMADILAASPGAVRSLRPLCRALGVTLPPILQRPPRPPRPKPARAKPEPWRPLRPIYPQRKPREPFIISPKSKMRRT